MIIKLHYLVFIFTFLNTASNAQTLLFKESKAFTKNEFTVITQPVFNEIKIYDEGTDFAEYFIFDLNEKLIRQGWFLNSIPLQYIPPGSYLLIVHNKNELLKRQFLKLKPENSLSALEPKDE